MLKKLFSYLKIIFVLVLYACTNAEISILVTASAKGDLVTITEILQDTNIDINESANDGWNALTVSSREGHINVVKYLLDHGANINSLEKGGNSSLFWAAFGGHEDIVNLLLDRGVTLYKNV